MRSLRILLVMVATWMLAGCSQSGSAGSGAVVPPPPVPLAPIEVTAQNASGLAFGTLRAVDLDLLVPGDDPDGLPTLNPNAPGSCAMALARASALMGEGVRTSPLGGTWTVDAGGRVVFDRLDALTVVVDGSLLLDGSPDAFTARFDQLRLRNRDHETVIDGPAQFRREGSQVTWIASYTMVEPRGKLELQNFTVTTNLLLEAGQISGSKTYDGDLLIEAQGATGQLSVRTEAPVTFSGPFQGGSSSLQLGSGQVTVRGAQAFTLRGTPTGAVAMALEDGTSIKTVPWAYLGGSIQAARLVRALVADTLLTNATFVTIDPERPQAQALAALEGRILAVGSAAEVQEVVGSGTRVLDMGGRTCLPGFVEPHIHVNLTALNFMSNVTPLVVDTGTYAGLSTKAAALSALAGALGPSPQGPAVFGYGFDPSRLAPPETMRALTLEELDTLSASVPIVVQNSSGHISYANSAAFRATGIWPTAPNGPFAPPAVNGDEIVVDPSTGLPTGQLNEDAQDPFLGLVVEQIVAPRGGEFLQQFLAVLDYAASQGVTTAGDQLTGALLGLQPEEEVLATLARTDHPVVRLHAYVDSGAVQPSNSRVFAGEGTDAFRIQGVKFISDGSTQGLTAALNFDYRPTVAPFLPGPPNGTLDFPDSEELLSQMSAWHDLGFQISTHSNGDRAQDQVLGVYARLAPRPDPRFLMHHFTVHTDEELPAQLARVKALGVNVSMTIGHVFFWGEVFNDTILDPQVAKNIDPTRALVEAGIPFSFHSDSPISPIEPLRYVETGVTRLWQTPVRQVLGPSQRLTVDEALKAVTIDAARAIKLERKVGSLEVGKYADLVVLGADPRLVPPSQIAEIPVVATFVGGKQVSGDL